MILACRSLERGRQAAQDIAAAGSGSGKLRMPEVQELNLNSLDRSARDTSQAHPDVSQADGLAQCAAVWARRHLCRGAAEPGRLQCRCGSVMQLSVNTTASSHLTRWECRHHGTSTPPGDNGRDGGSVPGECRCL